MPHLAAGISLLKSGLRIIFPNSVNLGRALVERLDVDAGALDDRRNRLLRRVLHRASRHQPGRHALVGREGAEAISLLLFEQAAQVSRQALSYEFANFRIACLRFLELHGRSSVLPLD